MNQPSKEMIDQLVCPYWKDMICVQRLTCTGYCGKLQVNKIGENNQVIDSYELGKKNDNSN